MSVSKSACPLLAHSSQNSRPHLPREKIKAKVKSNHLETLRPYDDFDVRLASVMHGHAGQEIPRQSGGPVFDA